MEIRVSRGIGWKTLANGAVPSVFKFKNRSPKKIRKLPTKRSLSPIEETSESEYEDDDIADILPFDDESGLNIESFGSDSVDTGTVDYLDIHFCCREKNAEINRLKGRIDELDEEMKALQIKNEILAQREFNFKNVASDPTFFKKVTGIETDAFIDLYDFLNLGEKMVNVKYYRSGSTKNNYTDYLGSKPGPTPKHDSKTQLLMFLVWLRTGITLHLIDNNLVQFLIFLLGQPTNMAFSTNGRCNYA